MCRPNPVRADVTERVHRDLVKLAQKRSDLPIGRDELLLCQRRLEPTKLHAVKLSHENEIEIEQVLRVIEEQNARTVDSPTEAIGSPRPLPTNSSGCSMFDPICIPVQGRYGADLALRSGKVVFNALLDMRGSALQRTVYTMPISRPLSILAAPGGTRRHQHHR
jgi:hypothetical protein